MRKQGEVDRRRYSVANKIFDTLRSTPDQWMLEEALFSSNELCISRSVLLWVLMISSSNLSYKQSLVEPTTNCRSRQDIIACELQNLRVNYRDGLESETQRVVELVKFVGCVNLLIKNWERGLWNGSNSIEYNLDMQWMNALQMLPWKSEIPFLFVVLFCKKSPEAIDR